MSFQIRPGRHFRKEAKRLQRKYPSLKAELARLGEALLDTPTLGTPIGSDCYKIRLAIKSKGKGKSGGARVITYVRLTKSDIVLLTIYDKSEQSDISEAELDELLKSISEE